MKSILLAACILGAAICAPLQKYMEFDIRYAPAEAAQAIPAGVPLEALDVILAVDAQGQPLRGPARGFIKYEIPLPMSTKTAEVYYPFGFNLPDPAPAAPAAPAPPAPPAAPAGALSAPVAPVAPVDPITTGSGPARKVSKDDDDDDDDD